MHFSPHRGGYTRGAPPSESPGTVTHAVGTTSQQPPALRGGSLSGASRRLDARVLAGLFRIALVPALRVLCQDVSPLHARASQ